MTPLQVLLSQIMEMAEKASKGPWDHAYGDVVSDPISKEGTGIHFNGFHICTTNPGDSETEENEQQAIRDADFIAASRTLVPQLVKALEKAIEHRRFLCTNDDVNNACDEGIRQILLEGK